MTLQAQLILGTATKKRETIMTIRSIAFDLDDTLLDTTGLLVPQASQDAFQILIDAGLSLDLKTCEEQRLSLIRTISHKDVFKKLAHEHGNSATQAAVELANKAFYHPRLPEKLDLLPGALENLNILSQKYNLYLVTAGFQDAQSAKVNSLGISHFFKKIFVVNSLNAEKKFTAFKMILDGENIKANELLCVGNSLSSEIKDARQIGAWACYFEFGEDRGSVPKEPEFQPHFHVKTHQELIAACQL
ncbi:HAD family hydrolase [Bdellovibrio sp. qaytius]|nr:HAD family hydrolase [Bdellovibrio sp. qaytius]